MQEEKMRVGYWLDKETIDLQRRQAETEENVLEKPNKLKKLQTEFYEMGKQAHIFTPKQAKKVKDCQDWIKWATDATQENYRVVETYLCGHRLCPTCNWHRSLRDSRQIAMEMQYLKQTYGYRFIFVTLTVVNCKGKDTRDTISKIKKAWGKLRRRKKFMAICQGAIVKLELTKSQELEDSYHPHLHLLIAVKRNYFIKHGRNANPDYLEHDELLKMWQECMEDSRITQVDIRKVKGKKGMKAVLEMAKYVGKATDYLENPYILYNFNYALRGQHLIDRIGKFLEAQEQYEQGKLDYMLKQSNIEYVYIKQYRWYMDKEIGKYGYELQTEQKINALLYVKLNKHLLDKGKDLDTHMPKSSTSTNFN